MKDTWEGMNCGKTHQWVLDQQHQAGDDNSSSKPEVENDRGDLQACTVTLCEHFCNIWDAYMGSAIAMTTTVPFCYRFDFL